MYLFYVPYSCNESYFMLCGSVSLGFGISTRYDKVHFQEEDPQQSEGSPVSPRAYEQEIFWMECVKPDFLQKVSVPLITGDISASSP